MYLKCSSCLEIEHEMFFQVKSHNHIYLYIGKRIKILDIELDYQWSELAGVTCQDLKSFFVIPYLHLTTNQTNGFEI